MYLKKEEAFYTMFYILDYVYSIENRDDLGAILGAISPELTSDYMPIDMAIYYDWKDFILDKTIDEKNVITFTERFLKWYGETYGFDFSLSFQVLNDKIEKKKVDECVNNSIDICKIHDLYFD